MQLLEWEFLVLNVVYAVYAFRTVVGTKAFMDQYKIDHSAAVMVRFFGAAFIGSILMAIYIMFVRDGGVNGKVVTWLASVHCVGKLFAISSLIVILYAKKVQ